MLNHCQCPNIQYNVLMCIIYVCHRSLVRWSSPERPNAMYSPCCSLATSWVTMLLPAMAHRTSYPIDASKTSQFSFVCGSIPSIRSDGGTFKFFGTLQRDVLRCMWRRRAIQLFIFRVFPYRMCPKSTKNAMHHTDNQSGIKSVRVR